jgi:ubiquinone/menaquinone biosynthesis C-methylase UbiE
MSLPDATYPPQNFDAMADGYERNIAGRQSRTIYPQLVELASSWQAQSVLDVGCGPGRLLEMLRRPGVQLAGVDISELMIKRARECPGKDADLRVADSERLPWAAGSFDLLLCCLSFHHYPNPEVVLAEMNRVLRKGGHLIIADPSAPWPCRNSFSLGPYYREAERSYGQPVNHTERVHAPPRTESSESSGKRIVTFLMVASDGFARLSSLW